MYYYIDTEEQGIILPLNFLSMTPQPSVQHWCLDMSNRSGAPVDAFAVLNIIQEEQEHGITIAYDIQATGAACAVRITALHTRTIESITRALAERAGLTVTARREEIPHQP